MRIRRTLVLFPLQLPAFIAALSAQDEACDAELSQIALCLDKYDSRYENCGPADVNCKCIVLGQAMTDCIANTTCQYSAPTQFLDSYAANACGDQRAEIGTSAMMRFEGDSVAQHSDDMFLPPNSIDDGASYDFNTGESDFDRSFYDGFFAGSTKASRHWGGNQAPPHHLQQAYAPVFRSVQAPRSDASHNQFKVHRGIFDEPVAPVEPAPEQYYPGSEARQPAFDNFMNPNTEMVPPAPLEDSPAPPASNYHQSTSDFGNIHLGDGPDRNYPQGSGAYAPSLSPVVSSTPAPVYEYELEPSAPNTEEPVIQQPVQEEYKHAPGPSSNADKIFGSHRWEDNLYSHPSRQSSSNTHENLPYAPPTQDLYQEYSPSLDIPTTEQESTLSFVPDYTNQPRSNPESEYPVDLNFSEEDYQDQRSDMSGTPEDGVDYAENVPDSISGDYDLDETRPSVRIPLPRPPVHDVRPVPHWPPANRKYRYDEFGNVDDPDNEEFGYFDFTDFDFEDGPIILDDEMYDYEEMRSPYTRDRVSSTRPSPPPSYTVEYRQGKSDGYPENRYQRQNELIYDDMDEDEEDFEFYPIEIEDEDGAMDAESEESHKSIGFMQRLRDKFNWLGSANIAATAEVDPLKGIEMYRYGDQNTEAEPDMASTAQYKLPGLPEPIADLSSLQSSVYLESVDKKPIEDVNIPTPPVQDGRGGNSRSNATMVTPGLDSTVSKNLPEPTLSLEEKKAKEAKDRERDELLKAKARLSAQRKDKARKAEEAQRQAFRGMEHDNRGRKSTPSEDNDSTMSSHQGGRLSSHDSLKLDQIESENSAPNVQSCMALTISCALALLAV